ncbi:MAG: hypothetical protein IT454_04585 [Planctomycetes bacterium]|nr:hypothetical protein [Planctomycetota bacterium]
MNLRWTAISLAAALLLGGRARAQEVMFFDGGEEFFDGGEVQEAPGQNGETPAAKPGPRTEKLKKLEFDRRPSAILAAWSKPPGAKKDAATDGAELKTGAVPESESPQQQAVAGALAKLGYVVSSTPAAGSSAVVSVAGTPALTAGSAPAPAPAASGSVAATPSAPAVAVSGTPLSAAQAPAGGAAATSAAPASSTAGGVAADDPDAAKKAEEAAQAKAAADEAAAKAKEAAEKAAAEAKAIDEELATLKRNVTLGDWPAVKSYLAGLADDEKKAGYEQILKSLQEGPRQRPNVPPQGQQYIEKNVFSPADVLGLAAAAPLEISKENLALLGKILSQSLTQGHQLATFLATVKPRVDEEGFALNRRRMALVLVNANQAAAMGDYLPSFEEAEKAGDRDGLNLISRWCLAKHDEDKKVAWLERAWSATQAVLAVGEVTEEAKTEAITRAVDIAPKIRDELGQAWLDESFAARPERGMEILAAIGSTASTTTSAKPLDLDRRQKLLELQTTATNALLSAAPALADQWKPQLNLLASNWLREAQITYQFDDSTSLGPRMQRDRYGNYYYYEDEYGNSYYGGRGNYPTPIKAGQVLENRPTAEWIARLDDTLQPRLSMIFAQLYLKVGEESDAFPYIEELARTNPKPAKELVDEFLRVWAKNHDPNQSNNRRNPYVYFYGFDERANAIPLTRSKQERNLIELGQWVARLRALSVEIDQKLVAQAFRSAHSTAEVFRLESMELIFGPMQQLEPAMIAELVQTMRANLVAVWRDPALQKDKKTNRKQKDIEAEVARGYELARTTVQAATASHPKSWELALARAAIEHDQNEFEHGLKKSADYSQRRDAAFASFARAGELYTDAAATLATEKETTQVFETWFYAALGACDLAKVDHEKQLVAAEIPKIKAALEGLPAERAERHMEMFGNALTTRIGSANPAVKSRYVREGLAITGETKMTRELAQLHGYYKDLVTEIQLRATIDGSTAVGHGEPFGLAIDLRHTREIEREAGGFAKYLQNQNSQNYAYNYGRPLEDYRDKFEEAARESLKEGFEVLSITFNKPETTSKADVEYGWRVTPYAYLLLKPKSPAVDRVPPLKLDLDFLDTSGYAVLPVESAPIVIDAKEPRGEQRPFTKLALTQTLDERQAKSKRLILEIKASGIGLVPSFDALLDFQPEGFDIAAIDDRGNSLAKFDDEGQGVVSERMWTVTLTGREGVDRLPATFTFGKPKLDTTTHERFRYVDADLAAVGETVPLDYEYGEKRSTWPYWLAAAAAAIAAVVFALRRTRRIEQEVDSGPRIPEPLTPFTVLHFMRQIEGANHLPEDKHRELADEMATIERRYFGDDEGAERPDLRRIAEKWAAHAS